MVRQGTRLPIAGIILVAVLFSTAVSAGTSAGYPVPVFSVNTSTGTAPLAVRFTDLSAGSEITGWAWDFNNDGITDSTDQDPDCVYRLPGNYTVRLTVTNASGSRTISRANAITVRSPVPVPAFTADNVTGIPPLEVRFRDVSGGQNITGRAWDFNGDGITDSTEENPSCVYLRAGNFTVSLTETNAYGSNTTTRTDAVRVTNGAGTSFSANQTNGTAPLAVRFTDTSTGSEHHRAGPGISTVTGSPTARTRIPTASISWNGNYTVSLTVTNAFGPDTVTRAGIVTVTNGAVPAFTANQTRGIVPLAVQFRDMSTGPNITGLAWDFNNDGITDSTDPDPVCVYLLPDRYTVNLTLTNAGGSDTASRQDFIQAGSLAPVPGFVANATTGVMPLAVQFTDTSTGANITGRTWDFNNDGIADSTDPDPVCVYNLPGNYTVSLRLANEHGSNATTRRDLIAVSDGYPAARFAVNRTAGPAPLAVRFRDMSAGPAITGWAWDIDSDGIVDSTDKDFVNTYQVPGNYTVQFSVANAWGSDMVVRKDFIQVT